MSRLISLALTLPVLVLSLATSPLEAEEFDCDLNRQMNMRMASLADVSIQPFEDAADGMTNETEGWFRRLQVTFHNFQRTEFAASTYSCSEAKVMTYPETYGIGFLLEIPVGSFAEVLLVREEIGKAVEREPERYMMLGDVLVDRKQRQDVRIRSTVDFLVEGREVLFDESGKRNPRLALSGPYWRVAEFGEKIIGYLKTSKYGERHNQQYENFSARHILCISGNDVDVILAVMNLAPSKQKQAMEKKAKKCAEAIQVGPNYLAYDGEQHLAGIGGLSLNEKRRNILMRVGGEQGQDSLFLWSTVTPISAFDAMVVLEKLADSAADGRAVKWAVSLADGEMFNGPLIFGGEGSAIALSEVERSVGAFLVFFEGDRVSD